MEAGLGQGLTGLARERVGISGREMRGQNMGRMIGADARLEGMAGGYGGRQERRV